MPEPTESSKRQQLLARIIDYVLEHGIAELTLRDLAAAVGSNNRMLLYYFGSRDALILTALRAAAGLFPRMADVLVAIDDRDAPLRSRLNDAWTAVIDSDNLPYHRLFFQVFGLAGFAPDHFAELLDTVGSEWVDHVASALRDAGAPEDAAGELAHAVVALWRGLQLTLISTGDEALVERVGRTQLDRILAGL